MIYTAQTKKAIKLMYDKHKNQKDKGGMPYVLHPLHLAEQMDDEDSTVVALLHDIVEDTDITITNLNELGFTKEQIEAINIMTHPSGMDYFDYIKRIATNDISLKVKLADLQHNMDLTRLNNITINDLERIKKYRKCYDYLLRVKNFQSEKKENSELKR